MAIFTLRKPQKDGCERSMSPYSTSEVFDRVSGESSALVGEDMFEKFLSLERKSSERSRQRFVLMLVDVGKLIQSEGGEGLLMAITRAVHVAIRETDLPGWYKQGRVLGVICTEIGAGKIRSILDALRSRASAALGSNLSEGQLKKIDISCHVYPEDKDHGNEGGPADSQPLSGSAAEGWRSDCSSGH